MQRLAVIFGRGVGVFFYLYFFLAGNCQNKTVLTIDVGLVVAQFSAEITTEADFIVEQPEGQRTVLPKGKYFAAVEQGKIRLGEALLSGGVVLEMPFNEKEAANKSFFP